MRKIYCLTEGTLGGILEMEPNLGHKGWADLTKEKRGELGAVYQLCETTQADGAWNGVMQKYDLWHQIKF